MNERIKELAGQADNYAYMMNPEEDSYGRPANPRKFQQDRDTKFSELIVKECLEIAIEEERHAPFEGPVETKIRQHFGVEE
jgi:hypothetical protein